jgi:hypothetical protein
MNTLSRDRVTIDGVWIGDFGTTSNYNAVADLHPLQITRAHAKSSQSAFTSHFLVMDLNNRDSSTSMLTSLPAG